MSNYHKRNTQKVDLMSSSSVGGGVGAAGGAGSNQFQRGQDVHQVTQKTGYYTLTLSTHLIITMFVYLFLALHPNPNPNPTLRHSLYLNFTYLTHLLPYLNHLTPDVAVAYLFSSPRSYKSVRLLDG